MIFSKPSVKEKLNKTKIKGNVVLSKVRTGIALLDMSSMIFPKPQKQGRSKDMSLKKPSFDTI